MNDALLPVFGGPAGAHALRRGAFFRPAPWAIGIGLLLFTLLYLRHQPCLTTDPANHINAYIRLCYSDLPVNYTWLGWAAGGSPLGGDAMSAGPLVGMLAVVTLALARLLGADIAPGASEEVQYAGMPAFFGAASIVIFAFFLVLVVASTRIAGRERRGWDVLFIAASPMVLAAGLINWDLVGLGLTALGMLGYLARRAPEAGIMLGLAACASTMPLAFALAVAVTLLLRRELTRLALFGGTFALTWLLVHLPLLLRDADAVWAFYHGEMTKDVSYGTPWFLLQHFGVPLRELGAFAFVLTVLAVGILVAWLYVTGRRPDAGPLALVFVLLVVLLAPALPPQTSLWVVFALFLARPVDRDAWIVTAVHVIHYAAVWGWLSGHLTRAKSGPEGVYVIAVLARWLVDLVLLVITCATIRNESVVPRRAVVG